MCCGTQPTAMGRLTSVTMNAFGYKTAYWEAEKAAELALTVLQTLCLFLVRSPPSEDPAQLGQP